MLAGERPAGKRPSGEKLAEKMLAGKGPTGRKPVTEKILYSMKNLNFEKKNDFLVSIRR